MANQDNKIDSGAQASFSTGEDSKFVDKRITNVKSDLIEITGDKLENILLKHLHMLGTRKSWITPLSLLVTVLLADLTANFGDRFGIKGPVWEALFLLIIWGSLIWFFVSLICLCIHWKKSSLSNLINVIKNAKEERKR